MRGNAQAAGLRAERLDLLDRKVRGLDEERVQLPHRLVLLVQLVLAAEDVGAVLHGRQALVDHAPKVHGGRHVGKVGQDVDFLAAGSPRSRAGAPRSSPGRSSPARGG